MFVLQDNKSEQYFVYPEKPLTTEKYYAKSFKNAELAIKYMKDHDLEDFDLVEYHF